MKGREGGEEGRAEREELVWEDRDREKGGEGGERRESVCWSQYKGEGGQAPGLPSCPLAPLAPLPLCLLQAPAQCRAGGQYPESPHLFTPLRASSKSTV